MKKVILTIFLAFTAAVYAGAATPTAARDTSQVIPIIGGDGSGLGGGPRSLQISGLQACVVSLFGDYYIVVTVTQNLGMVEFVVTNTTTGEYLDGEFNALPGSYPIPISGSPGYYTVLFTLPDGRSCYGCFELA